MAVDVRERKPAGINDGGYAIDATTIAPMVELEKEGFLKETGKEEVKAEYSDIITVDDFTEGFTISVQDGGRETENETETEK